MTTNEMPVGRLYSRAYLEKGNSAQDSARMRVRLCAAFTAYNPIKEALPEQVRRALGRQFPYGIAGYDFNSWFEKAELRDLLDTITLCIGTLKLSRHYADPHNGDRLILEVERIFREENVAFTIDERGGVHPQVDTDYQRLRTTTLMGLAAPRYAAVREAYDKVRTDLNGNQPDYKSAIRNAFDAAETIFKLMAGKKYPRLGASEARDFLKPAIEKLYANDIAAAQGSLKLLNAFCSWVDAAHFYRHAQGTEEPRSVPMELGISLTDSAASYLRWLCAIDCKINE